MKDPRIEIPAGLRNAGLLGGVIMIILGLWIGWKQADQDIVLPATGYKAPPKGPGTFDRIADAFIEWLRGKKE